MGVIVKYKVEFKGLTVSNDLYSGEFVLDADIQVAMLAGTAGSKFEIRLYDLPEDKVKNEPRNGLFDKLSTPKECTVTIRLGYFDGPFEQVAEGVYTKVTQKVEGGRLVTIIEGLESATHALQFGKFERTFDGEQGVQAILNEILTNATFPEGEVQKKAVLDGETHPLPNYTTRGKNVMEILDDLAHRVGAELFVFDKTVRLGRPVVSVGDAPEVFESDRNLAKFQAFRSQRPMEIDLNRLDQPVAEAKKDDKKEKKKEAQGFQFVVTGDPKLRPAQKVRAAVDGFEKEVDGGFRVHSVVHRFTTAEGYVCDGVAKRVSKENFYQNQRGVAPAPSAEGVAQSLNRTSEARSTRRTAIQVGKVKTYTAERHVGAFYIGQPSEGSETQASVRAEVETNENQVLLNRPIVAPFAWHKCGLVVPVYPGMKALLAHNLNDPNDALVTGFLWSERPQFEPPKNHVGDWWLCLPIDFDASQPPTDGTKAANDLIANNGKRVIEVKGLKITVGAGSLRNVGARPEEGSDDECSIEHPSGAKITVKDGAIELTDGTVTLKISGGTVDIS